MVDVSGESDETWGLTVEKRENAFEWQRRKKTFQFGRNDKMIKMHIVHFAGKRGVN